MSSPNKAAIVTYYGLDGACAAAMALLKFPDAAVVTSSANRIGETFVKLQNQGLLEVHVCGVGVNCEWSTLEEPARSMTEDGTGIYWYCGRDYLVSETDRFKAFCTPVFLSTGTNTAGVAQHLGLESRSATRILMDLAWCDHNVRGSKAVEDRSVEQADWIDLVNAAMSHYFKYQDEEAYVGAIHKLARHEITAQDRTVIETFRRSGYRYVIHGSSMATRELRRRIQRCGKIDRHVIIMGESGVGKEHVAHLLWERSPQSSGPFIPVNCAMYTGNSGLANSDLFGHLKGAFTGAISNRRGRFVEADSGILFLDELGELPLDVQAKLLRVIEDGWVTPEGADKPDRQVRVRIITATNRDLPRRIRQGAFRADLYHRLATLRIHVPPLRERPEDVASIVAERLGLLEQEGYVPHLTKKDYEALHAYDWPGNVRQLIRVVERAVLLDVSLQDAVDEERAYGETNGDDDSEPPNLLFPATRDTVRPISEIQTLYARNVWNLYGRNYSAAARALGINPNTLRYTYLAETKAPRKSASKVENCGEPD